MEQVGNDTILPRNNNTKFFISIWGPLEKISGVRKSRHYLAFLDITFQYSKWLSSV